MGEVFIVEAVRSPLGRRKGGLAGTHPGDLLGAVQKADSRQAIVKRMLDLLDGATSRKCDLVVYPELALTTFFPRWHMTDPAEIDIWFEREMPSPATRPLFEQAARHNIAISFGYAELTSDGHHFNTSILVDGAGNIVGKYRKIHLPGTSAYDREASFQHLEKLYFEPGDLGFPVWRAMGGILGMCICNDRRWPAWRRGPAGRGRRRSSRRRACPETVAPGHGR